MFILRRIQEGGKQMRPILRPRQQALFLDPSCTCKAVHNGARRIFHVSCGNEVLGSAVSPTVAWERALSKLLRERAIDHLNGDPRDNRPENLRVVTVKESFGTVSRHRERI